MTVKILLKKCCCLWGVLLCVGGGVACPQNTLVARAFLPRLVLKSGYGPVTRSNNQKDKH